MKNKEYEKFTWSEKDSDHVIDIGLNPSCVLNVQLNCFEEKSGIDRTINLGTINN